jgi:hypothetical protein
MFRIPHKRLLKGCDSPLKGVWGDVDVCGACLETSSVNELPVRVLLGEKLFLHVIR